MMLSEDLHDLEIVEHAHAEWASALRRIATRHIPPGESLVDLLFPGAIDAAQEMMLAAEHDTVALATAVIEA